MAVSLYFRGKIQELEGTKFFLCLTPEYGQGRLVAVKKNSFIQQDNGVGAGFKQGFVFCFRLFAFCNLFFKGPGSFFNQAAQGVPVFSQFVSKPAPVGNIPDIADPCGSSLVFGFIGPDFHINGFTVFGDVGIAMGCNFFCAMDVLIDLFQFFFRVQIVGGYGFEFFPV